MAILTIDSFRLISAILAILFGLIIIKWKQSLNYIIGIYFILIGILGILASV